jgi:amino acid efflux transporter
MPLLANRIGVSSDHAGTERNGAAGLTWLQGIALYIGAVLGTGAITLSAMTAKIAGPASLLAWLSLIGLSIPLAVSFSALGAKYPDAGGIPTCVKLAFGTYPAGIVDWCLLFAVPVGAPAAAMFARAYVDSDRRWNFDHHAHRRCACPGNHPNQCIRR